MLYLVLKDSRYKEFLYTEQKLVNYRLFFMIAINLKQKILSTETDAFLFIVFLSFVKYVLKHGLIRWNNNVSRHKMTSFSYIESAITRGYSISLKVGTLLAVFVCVKLHTKMHTQYQHIITDIWDRE